ncbi:MAG: hypothetical protein Q4F26_01275 [Atopococcus tabaci]|uniref:Uncharacterized protein n=1 Tax=Atopococcus tabaci TaxID=269774 RepID=A0AA43UA72_9LACT|nr:hypothetical protein [Atopococcus tabaci]
MVVTVFKEHQSDGYILLESLISLSLVSLMLLIYVPFFSMHLQRHEEGKEKIEMMRSMHDISLTDNPKEKSEKSSGDYRFYIEYKPNSISIKNKNGKIKEKVEIKSIKSSR